MMTVTRVCHQHWHAVERDLISLGFKANDIGTPKLSLWEFISIVIAAPVGSAVREAMDGGWSQSDRLLANLGEQQAGVLRLTGRYPRPGIEDQHVQLPRATPGFKPYGGIPLDVMSAEELEARRANYFARHRKSG